MAEHEPQVSILNDLKVGDTLRIFLDPTSGYNKDGYEIVEDNEVYPCRCFLKWEEIEKYVTELKRKYPNIPARAPSGELIWVVEKIEPVHKSHTQHGQTSFMEDISEDSTHGAILKLLTAENLADIDELKQMSKIQQTDMKDGVSPPEFVEDISNTPFTIKVGLTESNGIIYINHSWFFRLLCHRITGDPFGLNQVLPSFKKRDRHKKKILSENPSVLIAEKTGHRASEWGITVGLGGTPELLEFQQIIDFLEVLWKEEKGDVLHDSAENRHHKRIFMKRLWDDGLPGAVPMISAMPPIAVAFNLVEGTPLYNNIFKYTHGQEEELDEGFSLPATGGGRKKRRKRRKTKRKKTKTKKYKRKSSKKRKSKKK